MKPDFYAYIPVEKHVSKKNNRPIWNGRLCKSQDLRTAENHLITNLSLLKNQQNTPLLVGDIWAVFRFYFKNYYTGKRRSKRVNDLSNLYELVQDCLQEAQIIENDADIVSHDRSRRLPGKENAVEIELYRLDNFSRLPNQNECPLCQS